MKYLMAACWSMVLRCAVPLVMVCCLAGCYFVHFFWSWACMGDTFFGFPCGAIQAGDVALGCS